MGWWIYICLDAMCAGTLNLVRIFHISGTIGVELHRTTTLWFFFVQKNIIYMCMTFAFMRKVLQSPHLSLSSYDVFCHECTFCHECKWHAHIGDVFPDILISYMHFSELVWIRYEVFKVTVKRSKGKSIRGWNELDRNEGFLNLGANQTGVTQLRAQM